MRDLGLSVDDSPFLGQLPTCAVVHHGSKEGDTDSATHRQRCLTYHRATHNDAHMPATPDFIGSRDVCLLFEIDKSTLSRWVAAGKLTPALRASDKANAAFLFHRKDVERLKAA